MNNLTTPEKPQPAIVYPSSKRYIYLGRVQLRIRELHSGASSLVTCLSGNIRFRISNSDPWISTKSILIPAGGKVGIDNQGAVISSCYLDASKPDFLTLKKQMTSVSQGIYYHHAHEDHLIQCLTQLREDEPEITEAQQRIEDMFYRYAGKDTPQIDPRIKYIIERLRNTASTNISVKILAQEVGISESGLIKLFNLHVGVPLRKHRLWYRLNDFLILYLSGVKTASAIKQSGFTDAAHLSRCYSGFFGVNFSYAFSKKTNVKYIFENRPTHSISPQSNILSNCGGTDLSTSCFVRQMQH